MDFHPKKNFHGLHPALHQWISISYQFDITNTSHPKNFFCLYIFYQWTHSVKHTYLLCLYNNDICQSQFSICLPWNNKFNEDWLLFCDINIFFNKLSFYFGCILIAIMMFESRKFPWSVLGRVWNKIWEVFVELFWGVL